MLLLDNKYHMVLYSSSCLIRVIKINLTFIFLLHNIRLNIDYEFFNGLLNLQMLLLDYTLWWGLLDTRRYLLEKLLHDIRSRTKIGRLCRSNVHEAWVNYVHQSSRVHLSHANDHRNDPSPYSCLQTTKTRESLDRQPRRWLQSPKRFQLTKRTEHATTWVHASTRTGITAAVLINCCIQIN